MVEPDDDEPAACPPAKAGDAGALEETVRPRELSLRLTGPVRGVAALIGAVMAASSGSMLWHLPLAQHPGLAALFLLGVPLGGWFVWSGWTGRSWFLGTPVGVGATPADYERVVAERSRVHAVILGALGATLLGLAALAALAFPGPGWAVAGLAAPLGLGLLAMGLGGPGERLELNEDAGPAALGPGEAPKLDAPSAPGPL